MEKFLRITFKTSHEYDWEARIRIGALPTSSVVEGMIRRGYVQAQPADSSGPYKYPEFSSDRCSKFIPWHSVISMEEVLENSEIDPQMLAHPGFTE